MTPCRWSIKPVGPRACSRMPRPLPEETFASPRYALRFLDSTRLRGPTHSDADLEEVRDDDMPVELRVHIFEITPSRLRIVSSETRFTASKVTLPTNPASATSPLSSTSIATSSSSMRGYSTDAAVQTSFDSRRMRAVRRTAESSTSDKLPKNAWTLREPVEPSRSW